jgi:2-polyprenyl-6-methoxyphenol hydroxylase-like FAD-dependent oxidoreductase
MNAPDILVRGAGVVGLTAALALARQGLQVQLLDARPAGGASARADSPAGVPADVRAYALNPASVALLQQLKVWDALPADARTAVHDMHVEGDATGAALDFSAWTQGAEALAWIVDVPALEDALRTAVRFAPHVKVLSSLPAGAARPALTLLAEGRDSATRQQLGARMPLQRYGQRAIAARLLSDQGHAGLARQWFRSPDVLALLPMDRPTPGHGLGLVWSVPDTQADTLMALDDSAFEAALNDATAGAAGHLRLAAPRATWPLALARAEPVCGPGWALLGDAAHLVHPLAGQGLNLGLADVAALVRVLAAREAWRPLGDLRLLQRYARERRGPTWLMGQVTDGLLQLFAHPRPLVKELRNRGLGLVNALPPLKRLLTQRALGG